MSVARHVLGALEEQVLEQVCEARVAPGLVLGAHVVHEVHGHDRRGTVHLHDDPQPVVEHALLEREVHTPIARHASFHFTSPPVSVDTKPAPWFHHGSAYCSR